MNVFFGTTKTILSYPGAGITKGNVEELKEKTSNFSGIQKYVAVIMDEMKIQENLVFDKTSGELIGLIDLGDRSNSNDGRSEAYL